MCSVNQFRIKQIRIETLVGDRLGLKHRRKDDSTSSTMNPLSPEGQNVINMSQTQSSEINCFTCYLLRISLSKQLEEQNKKKKGKARNLSCEMNKMFKLWLKILCVRVGPAKEPIQKQSETYFYDFVIQALLENIFRTGQTKTGNPRCQANSIPFLCIK